MKNFLDATFFVKKYFDPKSRPSEVSASREKNEKTKEWGKGPEYIQAKIQGKIAEIVKIDGQIAQTQSRIAELEAKIALSKSWKKPEINDVGIVEMTQDEKDLLEAKDFLRTLESMKKSYENQVEQSKVDLETTGQWMQEKSEIDPMLQAEAELKKMIDSGDKTGIEKLFSQIPGAKDMPQDELEKAMIEKIAQKWETGSKGAQSLNMEKVADPIKRNNNRDALRKHIAEVVSEVKENKRALIQNLKNTRVLDRIAQSNVFTDSEKRGLKEIQDILTKTTNGISLADLKKVEEGLTKFMYLDIFEGLKKQYEYMSKSEKIDEKILSDLESFKDLVDSDGYEDAPEDTEMGQEDSNNEQNNNEQNGKSIKKRLKALKRFYKDNNFLSKWADKERWAIKKMDNLDFSRIDQYQKYSSIAQDFKKNGLFESFSKVKASQANYEALQMPNKAPQWEKSPRSNKNIHPWGFTINGLPIQNNAYQTISQIQQKNAVNNFMANFQTSEKFKQAFPQSVVTIGGRSINASIPTSRESAMQAFLRWEPILITPLPDSDSSNKRQNHEPMILQNMPNGIFTEYTGHKFPIHSSRNMENTIKLHIDLTRHAFTEKLFRSPYQDSLKYFEEIFSQKFPDRRPEDEKWRFQETIFQELARVSWISEFNVSGHEQTEKLLKNLHDPEFSRPIYLRMKQTGLLNEIGQINRISLKKAENFIQMEKWVSKSSDNKNEQL